MDKILQKRVREKDLTTKEERDYYSYVKGHIAGVRKAYLMLVGKGVVKQTPELNDIIAQHDFSKLSEVEFHFYCKKFYENSDGSSEIIPQDTTFQIAKKVHELTNKHHWEFWARRDPETGDCVAPALDMPDDYIVEMVCDWMSVGMNKGDLQDVHTYYESKKEDILLTFKTRTRVEELLDKIKDQNLKNISEEKEG